MAIKVNDFVNNAIGTDKNIADEEIKKQLIKCIKKINNIFNTLKKDLKGNNADLIDKDFLRAYGDLLNKIADDLENFHKKW